MGINAEYFFFFFFFFFFVVLLFFFGFVVVLCFILSFFCFDFSLFPFYIPRFYPHIFLFCFCLIHPLKVLFFLILYLSFFCIFFYSIVIPFIFVSNGTAALLRSFPPC